MLGRVIRRGQQAEQVDYSKTFHSKNLADIEGEPASQPHRLADDLFHDLVGAAADGA